MDGMRAGLSALGLPEDDGGSLPESDGRFEDGSRYRVEIPSVEGPGAFETVLDAAAAHYVPVHRISQGSGIMLQTDAEIERMVALGAEHGVELCLVVGPRAAWDAGAQARANTGRVIAGSLRGAGQLANLLADVVRGCELGLRSVLVADIGQLWVLGRLRGAGDLPADLVLKTSVSLPAADPATARVLEDLGATTINLPVDLTVEQIASIRRAVSAPLGHLHRGRRRFRCTGPPLRHSRDRPCRGPGAPEVHRPKRARDLPAWSHLRQVVLATAEERVRRPAIGLELLRRQAPHLVEGRATRGRVTDASLTGETR